MTHQQFQQMATGRGFIAALDQSGGSTPGALRRYGVETWADDAAMHDAVHAMRTRIMTSHAFDGRVLAAILFDRTMESDVADRPAAEYLWQVKRVVPFLKIDQGLEPEADGVRLLKPMPGLADQLDRATGHGVFGTKMRSLVLRADAAGVRAVVDQQLQVALEVLATGLVPIVEPEVDITSPEKDAAERLLLDTLGPALDALRPEQQVILKLTLPEQDGLWTPLVEHPRVARVAALSGGYGRAEACSRLARNPRVIASFSRALTEGLRVDQSDADFDATLDAAVAAIHTASLT